MDDIKIKITENMNPTSYFMGKAVLLVNDQTNIKKKLQVWQNPYLSVGKKFFTERYFIFFSIMKKVWIEQAIYGPAQNRRVWSRI